MSVTLAYSTNAATIAARTRSAQKMSQPARFRARAAVFGLPCMYCGLTVCASMYEADGTLPLSASGQRVQRQDAHSLHLAHVVAEALGGKARPSNIGPAHKACNEAAGDRDSTPYVITSSVPATWPTASHMRTIGDVRECAPISADDAPSVDTMRAARARRGLPF